MVEWIEAQRGFPALVAPAQGLRRRAQHRAGLPDRARHHPGGLRQGVLRAARAALRGTPGRDPARRPEVVAPGLGRVAHLRPRTSRRGPRRTPATSRPSSPRAWPSSTPASARRPSPTSSARRRLFPEFAGRESPHFYLAAIYKDQGKPLDAIRELQQLTAISDSHYRGQLELARLLEDQGDLKGAAASLASALYISPFEPAVHEQLAALATQLGDRAGVVRARRSLVALDPVDRPEALYQLALALVEAGDAAAARREVLHALEIAPALPARPGAAAAPPRRPRRGRHSMKMAVPLALVLGAAAVLAAGDGYDPPAVEYKNMPYNGRFTFVRVRFQPSDWGPGRYMWGLDLKWNHDYPRAEAHFMKMLQELTTLDPNQDGGNILALDDPELFKYPVAYMCEPGFWTLSDKEAAGLRAYLSKGGFLIVDDFVGGHWSNFAEQMRKVLPERPAPGGRQRSPGVRFLLPGRGPAGVPPSLLPGDPGLSAASSRTTIPRSGS